MKKLTIREVKQMPDGATVESLAATVLTVYDPIDPSDAQAKKGIHKQGIIVGLGDEKLNMTLNIPSIHMDKSFEGTLMGFKCTKDDKGKLVGMVVNRWTDQNKRQRIGVDVWGNATFSPLMVEPEKEVTKEDAKNAAIVSPMHGVENYMHFYGMVYDVAANELEQRGLETSDIKDVATHYMIGLQQRGRLQESIVKWHKYLQSVDLVEEAKEVFDAEPVTEEPEFTENEPKEEANGGQPEKPDWRTVKDKNGKVISEMNRDDLIDLCITLIPYHNSDHPVIKAGFEAAMKSRDAMGLTFAEIYDVYEILLNNDHELEAIASAWDKVQGDNLDSEDISKKILMDQETYRELIKNHEPATV